MAIACIPQVTFGFEPHRKPIIAAFDQPHASSDGGAAATDPCRWAAIQSATPESASEPHHVQCPRDQLQELNDAVELGAQPPG